MSPLVEQSRALHAALLSLHFSSPVCHVYRPLGYARAPHERYLERWGSGPKRVLFLGMNPGPFGMAQTGVPFGEVSFVRDYLGVQAAVKRPAQQHPARPIEGFECRRSEVSGARFWGWVQARWAEPARFFSTCFVANYCPLVFMEASGRNVTPDQLSRAERQALYERCDGALERLVSTLGVSHVVGIGGFAERRAQAVLAERVSVSSVLHPSPASPLANRGWSARAEAQLAAAGVPLPAYGP